MADVSSWFGGASSGLALSDLVHPLHLRPGQLTCVFVALPFPQLLQHLDLPVSAGQGVATPFDFLSQTFALLNERSRSRLQQQFVAVNSEQRVDAHGPGL
jgi:hypothetical protein